MQDIKPDEFEEIFDLVASKGKVWIQPDGTRVNLNPGDKFKARGADVKRIELTKMGHRDPKTAKEQASYFAGQVSNREAEAQGDAPAT
jgi:hypothetical protein